MLLKVALLASNRFLGSVTWSDFEKSISAISAIEGKVLNLKRELAKEREAANERLAKRMKLDKAPTFKRRLTTSSILLQRDSEG